MCCPDTCSTGRVIAVLLQSARKCGITACETVDSDYRSVVVVMFVVLVMLFVFFMLLMFFMMFFVLLVVMVRIVVPSGAVIGAVVAVHSAVHVHVRSRSARPEYNKKQRQWQQ